jgi:hypothetical protein
VEKEMAKNMKRRAVVDISLLFCRKAIAGVPDDNFKR